MENTPMSLGWNQAWTHPFLSSPAGFAVCMYTQASNMAITIYNIDHLENVASYHKINIAFLDFQSQNEYWIKKAKRSFRVGCSSEQRTGSERKGATSGKL